MFRFQSLPCLSHTVRQKRGDYQECLLIASLPAQPGAVFGVFYWRKVEEMKLSGLFAHSLSLSRLHWITQCMVNQPFVTDTVKAYQWLL